MKTSEWMGGAWRKWERLINGEWRKWERLINGIEECIYYGNTHRVYLNEGGWYVINVKGMVGVNDDNEGGSTVYHRYCDKKVGPPFLHWKKLTCQGCGLRPPEGIAGLYVLHNWDRNQGVHHAD